MPMPGEPAPTGGGTGINWGAVLPVIGSLGGAAINAISQNQTNKANAGQVGQEEAFQERMRATQYQTAVKDMEAAGLNPALAYQQGGAGTPSGAAAQFQNPIQGNPLGDAIQAYNQFNTSSAAAEASRQAANLNQQLARKAYIEGTTEKLDSDLAQDPNYADKYRASKTAGLIKSTQEAQNYPELFRVSQKAIEAQAASAQSLTTLNNQKYQRDQLETNLMTSLNSTAMAAAKKLSPYVPNTLRLNP